jgi:hypothetical protein
MVAQPSGERGKSPGKLRYGTAAWDERNRASVGAGTRDGGCACDDSSELVGGIADSRRGRAPVWGSTQIGIGTYQVRLVTVGHN